MANTQSAAAVSAAAGRSVNPLCFLIDEDFVFRREVAKELRRETVDVVEFSSSSRLVDMVDDQNPDIVFVNLNSAAPHECVRALLALRDCGYAGAVQLFGRCELRMLESFNTVGGDCALTMLPPLQKPIKVATIHRIILDRKLGTAAAAVGAAGTVSLSEALTKNLIKFRYQPKYDLRANTIVGAEVVARVAHPLGGLLTPDQFLKGADEDELLKLSRLAVVNAVRASAHFHEIGIALQLAINIGVDNLSALPIADLVLMHRPDRSDWPGLILEIAERQVVNKMDLLKARLSKLEQAGVSIAIDNFGRGTSCLTMLNQIPFAEIKIDRSLVDGCAADAGNANICKTLIQMAHNFGARAVAVGISNEADLHKLAEFDCDMGQGFLFGEPMSMPQIDALITDFKSRSG